MKGATEHLIAVRLVLPRIQHVLMPELVDLLGRREHLAGMIDEQLKEAPVEGLNTVELFGGPTLLLQEGSNRTKVQCTEGATFARLGPRTAKGVSHSPRYTKTACPVRVLCQARSKPRPHNG